MDEVVVDARYTVACVQDGYNGTALCYVVFDWEAGACEGNFASWDQADKHAKWRNVTLEGGGK